MNKNPIQNDEKIPLIATFNRTLPDLRHIINKNWHILQIEHKLKEIFKNAFVVAFKGPLSGLGQFLATKSPLKMMENDIHFTLNALFVLKILKILFRLFGHVKKRLD